jgi:sRNA-binding protein
VDNRARARICSYRSAARTSHNTVGQVNCRFQPAFLEHENVQRRTNRGLRQRRRDHCIAGRALATAEDRRLPLKVGIFHDLKAALGGKVSQDQLSRALGTYCSAPNYQRRLKDGAARIDLDGQRAGTVTPSEAMWARAGRAERRDKYQRKRALAVKRSSLADLRAAGARRKATGG